MTKERLRILIGENIRRERKSRGISLNELAELMGLTTGFVGLVERGTRGTSPYTLFQLSNILDISIDKLIYRKIISDPSYIEENEEPETASQVKHKKLKSLIYDFEDEEMDFVLKVIEDVIKMKHARRGELV